MVMVTINAQGYKPVEWYHEDLEFVLPGQGQAYEWCGEWYYRGHFSDVKLHWVRVKRSCHRYECPVCWHDWQKREARAATRRLDIYAGTWSRHIVHYVLSPPDDVPHTLRGFRQARQAAYRIARSRGIRGGIMIYHERACRYYDESAYRETHSGHSGSHFHILGDGWIRDVTALYRKDRWVVKNLKIRRKGGVFRTMYYLLDHCLRAYNPWVSSAPCAKVRLHTVTWFGSLSYNKMRIPKELGQDLIYCPVCEEGFAASQWFILRYQGAEGPPDGEFGESVEGQDGFVLDRPLTTPFWG
jgi:hypothetical protein